MSKIIKNPFDPTFSSIPETYIKTSSASSLLDDIQMSSGAQAYFITGLRGSGKTVMMNAVCRRLVELKMSDCSYQRVSLINSSGLIGSLVGYLRYILRESGVRVNYKDWDKSEYQSVIIKMLKLLSDQNIRIVITLDEVDGSKQIAEFSQLFNLAKSEGLPLIVIMTGLPEVVDEIRNRKNLTFLYRAKRVYTESLDEMLMTDQYVRWLDCTFVLASRLVRLTKGYAYAFQLVGYVAFRKLFVENKDKNVKFDRNQLSQISKEVKQILFENSYMKLYSELPRQEQYYLKFVDGRIHLTEMAKTMDWKVGQVGRYRSILLKKRLIVPKGYGIVDYALPYFDEFIKALGDDDGILYLKINSL